MSSNERSSSRLAVTSWYSASMTASRSPSRVMGAPVVVLMVRMLGPEAFDGARLVRVYLDEVLRSGHRQHRLDALLDAGQLEVAAGAVDLPVQIHQAPDRGAVDVGDGRQVDQDVALAGGDERAHGRGKVAQNRIHEPRLADAHDRDAAGLVGFDIHQYAPVRFTEGPLGL